MTDYMAESEIDWLAARHYKVHAGIDRCFKDGETYPCRTVMLIESHRALARDRAALEALIAKHEKVLR